MYVYDGDQCGMTLFAAANGDKSPMWPSAK